MDVGTCAREHVIGYVLSVYMFVSLKQPIRYSFCELMFVRFMCACIVYDMCVYASRISLLLFYVGA